MEEDYPFRYRIPGSTGRESARAGRLLELVRCQLRNLLDVARLTSGGEELRVDGFRLLGPDGELHDIYPAGNGGIREEARRGIGQEKGTAVGDPDASTFHRLENAALYEPRIELIARQLESILSLVELESGGRPVEVDGFRLRNLEDWIGPHAGTPADIFNHAATGCPLDCSFCYNRGSVPALEQRRRSPDEELRELETRIRHYHPRGGLGIFPCFGGPREPLSHPHILRVLRDLRARTSEPFRICTSGADLGEDMIRALAELAPVFLDISLNSSDPARRRMLMEDMEPERAIGSLPLLSEAGIPYTVIVVAWPRPSLEGMLEDLGQTAAYAWQHRAAILQVNLPGYSRFLSPRPLFDTESVWGDTVSEVQRLRDELPLPLVVSPSLYEENLTRERKNVPEVIGVVDNSPAERWGVRMGDVIASVNGIRVKNRPQARDLATLLQESGARLASLSVRRGGRVVELEGDTRDCAYPFSPETGSHLGLVFMGTGLRTAYLERLRGLVRMNGAEQVLLFTSRLVRPTLEQLLRDGPCRMPEGASLTLEVPENRFFGGNIVLGDLLVVQDFIDATRDYLSSNGSRPDLVVVPSSPFHLSGWGRDLLGRPYLDIERETGIAVELLECSPIWD